MTILETKKKHNIHLITFRFLFELAEIPNFADRISCFMFQNEFDNAMVNLSSKVSNISSTCEV